MRAGQLRHMVRIETPIAWRDELGQKVVHAYDTFEVPAEVTHVSGGETIRGKQVDANATHLVRIRHTTGIDATSAVYHGGTRLQVLSVGDPTGMGRELQVTCASS